MDQRQRAVEILRHARELLVGQLSERIVDSEEGLLDDARGETYSGEIDALYEGLGAKLANVNALLAALRAPAEYALPAVGFDGTLPALVGHGAAYVQTDTNEVSRSGAPAQLDASALPAADLPDEGLEAMDKKAKKRIDVLQQKLQKLRQQLSGARLQPDEPDDITRLEREIAESEAEIARLKQS